MKQHHSSKPSFQFRDFAVFEALPYPIWVFDLDHVKMWWANQHAVELWSAANLEELLARDFSDTSEATKERLTNFRRKFATGGTVAEQWTFYPKGVPTVLACTGSGVLVENGRMALLAEGRPTSATDVAPNVLRGVEALNHMPLLVVIFSLNGKMIYQNPAASRAFLPELKRFDGCFYQEDEASELWCRVLEDGYVSLEAECHTRSGVRWYGVDCTLTRDPVNGDQMVLGNFRDLHDLKVTELALEQSMKKAEEMALVKSRFLANMSHEIRTPLNGVLGMAELLRTTQLDTVQGEYVTHMQDAAKILRTLIDDILDYSRLEAGRLVLNPNPFNLSKCFQNCVAMVSPQARVKNLAFSAACELDPAIFLHGDEIRISQVLINLLGNAIKFTATGEVRFQVTRVASNEAGITLRFTITDTGVGISEDDQLKLFARFAQADNSLRRGQAGTGLGLAICRELVELMEGRIMLESRLGRGSSFTVELTLPVVEPKPDGSTTAKGSLLPSKELDILLVEDNLTNQMVTKRILQRLGYDCRIAENGLEAIELFEYRQPDLILMDIVMPIMDGVQATRQIRQREGDGKRSVIVALTANVMNEEKAQYLAVGMDKFLPKPLEIKDLKALLAKWGNGSPAP